MITEIDNRRLAKVAKLAGAPKSPSAGVYFSAPLGTKVVKGQTLFTVYAQAEGELKYALEYLALENNIVKIL